MVELNQNLERYNQLKIFCVLWGLQIKLLSGSKVLLLFMNIISPKNSTGVVSLKQLIPQHQSLKLLILHTPFPLQIDTLPQCLNLVKLDLSKNSIKSFPYLGDLKYLRIAFIHENLLGIDQFVKIFEQNGQKSILSNNIVWVTYWGNKNGFLARHYMINKTNAIAFDKNIIVEEQRQLRIAQNLQGFCQQSDITDIYSKKSYLNEYTTEQQYMQDFWITLRHLRKKYEQVNPIIKVQKVFRGWIFREKLKRQFQKQKENYLILFHCFKQWKNNKKKEAKLKKIIKQGSKTYLLYKYSKINREYIYNRLRQLAQLARSKVLNRRLMLQNQIKFYSILDSNYKLLQDLYRQLKLQSSSAIFIYKQNINQFIEYVVPFVKLFCQQPIQHSLNQYYHLHHIHQPVSKNRQEFIKIIKTNRFSIVSYEKPLQRMLKLIKFKRPTIVQHRMKSLFGKLHISKQKKQKMAEQEKHLEQIKKSEKDQLIRIQGSYYLLKTIIRGIYFYNSKRLTRAQNDKHQRINFLSQGSIKQISSAVAIQRAWKGYIFRKRHQDELKLIIQFQKAATIIQRWFRRLPYIRKKYFVLNMENRLNQCSESCFYVDFEEYLQAIKMSKQKDKRFVMLEQHAQVYRNKQNKDLTVTWDDDCKRKQIKSMITIGKKILPQYFLAKLGLQQKEMIAKTVYNQNILERCDIAHLFHYKTETSIIKQFYRTYMRIQCHSKKQAKFRILGISLLSYNLKHNKSIHFYNKSDFSLSQLKNKTVICNQQLNIVCNQNMKSIKVIEQNCAQIQSLSIYMIPNKVFFQIDINKQPYKLQETFIIYLINHESNANKLASLLSSHQNRYEMVQTKVNKYYVSTPSVKQFSYLSASSNVQHVKSQIQRKILVKKRSIKQFKAKIKQKKESQPNFIIDNKSTDRIMQYQHQLSSSNSVLKSDKHSEYVPNNRRQISQIRQIHVRVKRGLQSKRQQQDFTKKFVNMGNFMQQQIIHDYYKRIKTQMEHLAYMSAEQARSSAHRSTSHKEQKLNKRYVKARELEQIHKSLIQQSKALGIQKAVSLRNNVEINREKRKKQKKQLMRKPRVPFAQQKFPLVHKKFRNLSVS